MRIEFSKICIVIVNYNSSEETVSLLKQLRNAKGGGEKKVYIVDSKSTENAREMIEPHLQRDEIFIQAEENYGYGKCCNIGIRKGLEWGAEYFLILNPDIKVKEEFLLRLLIALQAQKKSGIACPLTLSEDGNSIQSLGGSVSLWTGRAKRRFYKENLDNVRKDFEYADFPEGNAILIKREFFEDVGLFHEKFFLYYEDVELGLRAKKEYWKTVAIPKAKVYHKDTTRERLYDPLINYVAVRNQIWIERLYANFFQFIVFMIVSFLARYPLKFGRAFFTFHFKCAFNIIKGVFAGFFSRELFDTSHYEIPIRRNKNILEETVPEMPSIVFQDKNKKKKSLFE